MLSQFSHLLHQGGRTNCPAWGKEGKICNKPNHFAKCCKGSSNQKKIKTGNGPPFNGRKFSEFTEPQGFKHRKVTPKWAEANWEVGRIIQTIKKSANIAIIEGKNIRQEIQTTVRSYGDTPHVSTGESPNKLMLGRELDGRIPAKLSKQTVRESVQRRDAEFK